MSSHKSQRLSDFLTRARDCGQVILVGPLAMELPPQELRDDAAVMAVDGGHRAGHPSDFHYALGDGDSGERSALDEVFPPHKDQSDLALALGRIPTEVKSLHLWGFWGGRMDHHLCNLGEIHQFLLNQDSEVFIHSERDAGLLALPAGTHTHQLQGTFSVLSMVDAHFTIRGECRYPLEDATAVAPFSAHTLSNYATGEVEISCDSPFFLYVSGAQA